MIIYNTTFNVEENILDQWKKWVLEEFIPAHYATGTFTKHVFSKVLVEEDMGGCTYSLQFFTPNAILLTTFEENNQEQLDASLFANFNGKFVLFRTKMEVEDERLND